MTYSPKTDPAGRPPKSSQVRERSVETVADRSAAYRVALGELIDAACDVAHAFDRLREALSDEIIAEELAFDTVDPDSLSRLRMGRESITTPSPLLLDDFVQPGQTPAPPR